MTGKATTKLKHLGVTNNSLIIFEIASGLSTSQYLSEPAAESIANNVTIPETSSPESQKSSQNSNISQSLKPSDSLGNMSGPSKSNSNPLPKTSDNDLHQILPSSENIPVESRTIDSQSVQPPLGINFSHDPDENEGIFCKMEIDADNSCLFASLDYLLNGKFCYFFMFHKVKLLHVNI